MKLTVDSLIDAILSARILEKLQQELRTAMIDKIVTDSDSASASTNQPISGAHSL